MACDLINAYKNTETCKITMAGTGDRAYFFDKDDWQDAINADSTITEKGLPEPGYMGYYGLSADGTVDAAAVKKLGCLSGLLYGVDIKTDSGQVTSEKGADNEASSQVATFVVESNIEAFNELAHTLAFKNWGCLVQRVGGGWYMVMSPYKKATIENNFDSGTTYDSDHGFTVTVNASPAEYGVTFLPDGTTRNGVTMPDTTITKDDENGAALVIGTYTAATSLSVANVSVNVGATANASVTVNPTTGVSLTYTIKDKDIATVTAAGVVKGVKAGETVLTVTGGGKTDYAIVTVTASA